MRTEEAAHAEYMILYIDHFVIGFLSSTPCDDTLPAISSPMVRGSRLITPSYGDLLVMGFGVYAGLTEQAISL